MKKLFFFSMILVAAAALSCNRDRAVREEAANSLQGAGGTTNPSGMPSQSPTMPAATASAVPHYICPNNCAGGGGNEQANCPVCGTAFVHNQAYHSQPQTLPAPTPTPTPAPTTAEPAQNAAGVWHYTCAKGCAGGAGTPGACASCGGELAHNASYHN